jgi:hypothetical protein
MYRSKLMPVLHNEDKLAVFFTLVVVLEEADLICTIVTNTGTGMIIPPQMLLPGMCPSA